MPNHTLIYGGGEQTLVFVPLRIPSAATFGIIDLRYSEDSDEHTIVTAGTGATIDPLSTTLTLAAGRGADRRVVTLASVAGVELGRHYQIQDARGQREAVLADAVNVGAKTVRTRDEVRLEYASGSTFRGAEVRAAIPASWCDNEETFRADMPAVITWTLTGVEQRVVRETIALERARTQLATVQDVLTAAPTLATGRAGRADLTSALAQAHLHYQQDLRIAGIDPNTHHGGELAREAVKMLAIMYAVKFSTDPSDVKLHDWAAERAAELRAGVVVGKDKSGVVETDRSADSAKPVDIRTLVRIGF